MPIRYTGFGATPIPQAGRHTISTAAATPRGVPVTTGGEVDLYGDDPAPPDALVLNLTAFMRGTNYETEFRALRARARAKDVLWREWDDGRREWTAARLLQVPSDRESRNGPWIEPGLIFWLPLPLWYAEVPGSFFGVDLFDQDEEDLATLGAEGDAVDGTSTFYITNTGDLPATKVVFTITSGTGTISAITLTNVTTGHVLAWTGSLTTGQVLVIDAGNERVTKQGTAVWTGLTPPATKDRWFELAPGPNTVTKAWTDSATDDSSTIEIDWAHTSA